MKSPRRTSIPLVPLLLKRPPRPRGGRTHLAGVLTASLALGLLAACGGEPKGAAGDRVELTVFWWGGPQRAKLTQEALDHYAKSHPNVTFKYQWQGYTGYYDKLATTAAGGNVPDIFQLDDNMLSEYASRGLMLDLTPYVGSAIKLDGFTEGLPEAGKVDGKLYAVPIAQNTSGLVYDRTVVRQAGLPEPRIGWTWEQYVAWARQITEKTGGKVWGSMDPSGEYKALWVWLRQRGKEMYDGRRLGFSEADLKEWLDFWAKARAEKAVSPPEVSHVAATGDVSKQLVVTKKGAASWMHSNQLSEMAKGTDHELGLTAYPGDPKGAFVRASMFWATSARSKHAEEAVKVINWLANDPEAARILQAERGLPPNQQVREQVGSSLPATVQQVVRFEREVAPRLGSPPPPPPPGHGEVRKLLLQAAEKVEFGRASVDQAVKEFFAQADAALSR